MCEDAETRYTMSVKKKYNRICCGSDLIRKLPILVCSVLEQCLAIDLGFMVVGKIFSYNLQATSKVACMKKIIRV